MGLGDQQFKVLVYQTLLSVPFAFQLLIEIHLITALELQYIPKTDNLISTKFKINLKHLSKVNRTIACSNALTYSSVLVEEVSLDHLTELDRTKMKTLLIRHREVMASGPLDIRVTTVIEHEIVLTDIIPVYVQLNKVSKAHEALLNQQIEDFLTVGSIVPGSSPYNSPCFLVEAAGKNLTWLYLSPQGTGTLFPT